MTLDELKASTFVVGLKETERPLTEARQAMFSSRLTVMIVFHYRFAMFV